MSGGILACSVLLLSYGFDVAVTSVTIGLALAIELGGADPVTVSATLTLTAIPTEGMMTTVAR